MLRFLPLYLRSRFVLPVLAGNLVLLGIVTLWAWQLAPSLADPINREIVQRNVVTVVAVIDAAAVALTLSSPWPEMEEARGRTVRRVRLATFVVTTGLMTIAMLGLGLAWESPGAGLMLARAFLGWLGITLIVRPVLGDSRGWWVSFAWAGLSVIAGDSWRVQYPPWAWSLRAAGHPGTWILTGLFFLIGIATLVRAPVRLYEGDG